MRNNNKPVDEHRLITPTERLCREPLCWQDARRYLPLLVGDHVPGGPPLCALHLGHDAVVEAVGVASEPERAAARSPPPLAAPRGLVGLQQL